MQKSEAKGERVFESNILENSERTRSNARAPAPRQPQTDQFGPHGPHAPMTFRMRLGGIVGLGEIISA